MHIRFRDNRSRTIQGTILSIIILITFSLQSYGGTGARQPASQPPQVRTTAARIGENDDADLPAFLRGAFDKGDYLKKRDAQINLMQGLDDPRSGIKRAQAIQAMERSMLAKSSSVSTVNWTALGPAPIPNGQTNTVTNTVSGRVTAIAVHPANPDIVYVGTAQGGVYRSLNGGANWTAIFDNAQSLAIGSLALAPSNPTILYVGTGEANLSGDSYFGVGLYRIDNAQTTADLVGPINPSFTFFAPSIAQNVTTTCFTGRSISRIVVSPSDPATIFVATSTGIGGIGANALTNVIPPIALLGVYRSTNATSAPGSVTFQKLAASTGGSLDSPPTGNRRITDMVLDPASNGNSIICAAFGTSATNDGGVFLTTNALASTPTFTRTLSIGTATGAFVTTLSIAPNGQNPSVVLVGIDQNSGTLRKSTDAGNTWGSALTAITGFCDGQCWYDMVSAIDPANVNKMLVGGQQTGGSARLVSMSTNGGSSWSVTDGGLHADVHAIVFAPSNHNVIYTGNDGGIFRSTDGGSNWTSLNTTGFSATQFQSLAVHPTDPFFTIGGTQDNGTEFLQPDNTWYRTEGGDGGYTLIDRNATDNTNVTMYHTFFNSAGSIIGFDRTTSGSCAGSPNVDVWEFRGYYNGPADHTLSCDGTAYLLPNGIAGTDAVLFYAPMTLGPGNPNTLYFGTDRLYRSVDRGDNMTVVSQAPIVSGTPISAIGISPANDNIRIVGLENGSVYATTTGSSTLTNITSGSFPANPSGSTNRFVSRAVIDPNNSSIAYITFSFFAPAGQGVWKTTDLTSSAGWTAAGTGIPSVPINAFVIDPLNSNNLFAGTDIGVYNSTDGGAHWSAYSAGLPRVAVFDMAITALHTLRIATHGRGMWESAAQPLPIQIASFNAEITGAQDVTLRWSTAGEVNNYGFYVERRGENSSGYTTVSGLIPGAGSSMERHDYTFTDAGPDPGVYFYRLHQVDLDNGATYTAPIIVTISSPLAVKEENLPKAFALGQNFPNPFNPTTNIQYALPKPSHVSLAVYNLLGQQVASLVNEIQDAGYKTVQFGTTNLPSGIYVYRISAGTFSDVKKMIIVK